MLRVSTFKRTKKKRDNPHFRAATLPCLSTRTKENLHPGSIAFLLRRQRCLLLQLFLYDACTHYDVGRKYVFHLRINLTDSKFPRTILLVRVIYLYLFYLSLLSIEDVQSKLVRLCAGAGKQVHPVSVENTRRTLFFGVN